MNSNDLKTASVKYDQDKIDWSLVPFEALEDMTKVLMFGAQKYDAFNWAENNGFKYMRIIRALLRHIFAFMRGEDNDPESGLSHIAHAQCNLLFLAYYIRYSSHYNTNDDRYKSRSVSVS